MEANVTLMGAATRGILDALLNRDSMLAEFPRKDELAAIDDKQYSPSRSTSSSATS